MRTMILAAVAALAACAQPAPEAPPAPPTPAAIDAPSGEYALDPTHTSVLVRVNHFGLSNYTLRLAGVSGSLNLNTEDPTQSSVTVTVAADSVQTEYVGARDFDDELENSEWLDAATHPNITFASTGVELTGSNTGRVTGDLTIRGVTKPVTLDVTFNRAYRQHPLGFPIALVGFSARGAIKRSDFGMNVLQPAAMGGVGVSDDVAIEIEAEFTQAAAGPAPAN